MRHSSYLEVNLGLLAENVAKIRQLVGSAKILPMVKADAYGNGLVPVSRFLIEECGLSYLGCASLGEALLISDQCPGLKAQLVVFSDTEILNPKLASLYLERNIIPILHQRSELEMVLSSPELHRLPLHVKIDTGMNRLGLSMTDLEALAPRLRGRGIDHLLTHFACSYYTFRPGDKTDRQLAIFTQARQLLSAAGVEIAATSVANSGAIEQGIGLGETFVRPGLMLYGPPSVEQRLWDGHQISRFVTRILKLFSVKKGTPVGYGVNVTPEDGVMAVIPVGYGDGLLTFAAGASIQVRGRPARIFGRVNMDMAFLFLDPELGQQLRAGEEIEIWNHDNRSITELATQMKTIPYQLMCAISPRIPRVYKVK
jgi:alanine racemase